MPYASAKELPANVKSKIKSKKKRRQWMHVFNSEYARHGDESRAFASAWSTAQKALRATISKDEAEYVDKSIVSDHCATCSMFRDPNSCTLVRGVIAAQGWCKHFDAKSVEKGLQAMTTDFKFFLPLSKVTKNDDGTCTVMGYASTPTKDMDGEIVTLGAIKKALPSYMEWRNIREMHRLNAVGTAQSADVDDKGLFVTAKIVDKEAVKKCVEEVYKGFSVGGRKLDKEGDKITEIDLVEISLVDRPNNPDCKISLVKSAKEVAEGIGGYLLKVGKKRDPKDKALAQMAKAVRMLAKAGPPAAHDGFSLPAKPGGTGKNPTPKDDDTQNNKAADNDVPKAPYGDVEYADPGHQADKKKRYPIDTKKHVKAALSYINHPDNAAKYSPEHLASIKSKINAAAKRHGIGKKKVAKIIKAALADAVEAGEASREVALNKLARVDLPQVLKPKSPFTALDLGKSMSTAGSLAYCFDSIRSAQRSLMLEAKREGGDMKDKALAKRLGAIAQDLAGIIGQKAEHEGSEALDLSDADDSYLSTALGEDMKMNADSTDLKKSANGKDAEAGDDELTKAIKLILNKAGGSKEPSRAERLAKAQTNLKMARKARKMAKSAIADAHGICKAAYLAKVEKAAKDGKKGDDEDSGIAVMEKLNKAYSEIDKVGTFMKAARDELKKVASGLGPADGSEFMDVPPGVKNLSVSDLSTAAPGGKGGGSAPPLYPSDGSTYPGKAANVLDLQKYADKDGKVPTSIVELIARASSAEGVAEALRNLPAATGNRRPYTFDMRKALGGDGKDADDKNVVLFKGVNPADLGSGDESRHTAATARVLGNMLTAPGTFGKSIIDPDFKGAAGSART